MTRHHRISRNEPSEAPRGAADQPLLTELERLWGLRARPAPHDPQRVGWLVCASVLLLLGCGCGAAALAIGDASLLVPSAVAAGIGTAAAVVHRRHRAFRARRRAS